MWMYVLVFVAALAVDSIPIFAPPAWTVLVALLLLFHLNPWLVVIIGVIGSTLGRYILSIYIPKVSSALVTRREDENLRYVGGKVTKAQFAAAVFVLHYTLTPFPRRPSLRRQSSHASTRGISYRRSFAGDWSRMA